MSIDHEIIAQVRDMAMMSDDGNDARKYQMLSYSTLN